MSIEYVEDLLNDSLKKESLQDPVLRGIFPDDPDDRGDPDDPDDPDGPGGPDDPGDRRAHVREVVSTEEWLPLSALEGSGVLLFSEGLGESGDCI